MARAPYLQNALPDQGRLLDASSPSAWNSDKLKWQQWVLTDRSLTSSTRLFAAFLTHDLNIRRGGAWRSQEHYAELLGVDVKTIQRATRALTAAGHLRASGSAGRGRTILYQAVLKPGPRMVDIGAPEEGEEPDKFSVEEDEFRTEASEIPDSGARQVLEENIHPPSFPPPGVLAGEVEARQICETVSERSERKKGGFSGRAHAEASGALQPGSTSPVRHLDQVLEAFQQAGLADHRKWLLRGTLDPRCLTLTTWSNEGADQLRRDARVRGLFSALGVTVRGPREAA